MDGETIVYGKILVVGSERGHVESLASRLRTKGYAVDVAYDGQDGLSAFGSTEHDLVITDLLDPQDRHLLLSRVKARAREVRSERSLHAIDLSPESLEDVGASERAGATTAYRKPYEIDVLMRRVDQLLDKPENG